MATVSAREFNRDVSAAKRAADTGPVVVTDRGEPAYVAVDQQFRALKHNRSLVDRLSMFEDIDIEFERSSEPIDPARTPSSDGGPGDQPVRGLR